MNAIFKKLNFKDQPGITVLNAPLSFAQAMAEVAALASVNNSLPAAGKATFVLAFVTKQQELDKLIPKTVKALADGGLLWFAYPKKSSKKYSCDFNRDTGWAQLGALGFEPVRMVAIDEDWSALRFKKAGDIKVMKRSFAMSDMGKKKVNEKK